MPFLAVAQACGIVLADRGILRADAALVLGLSAAALGVLSARDPRARAALALLTALSAGGFALAGQLDSAARARPLRATELSVEATLGRVDRGPQWLRVELDDVTSVTRADHPAPRRVTLLGRRAPAPGPSLESALPGQRIRARVRLRAPRGLRNPGSRDAAERARRAGIGAVGRLAHPALHARLPGREGPRPFAMLHELRARAIRRLEREGRGGALVRALALGDRSGLGHETRAAFASLGLAHLLAVSGLHLALLASLGFLLARAVLTRIGAFTARWDARGPALVLALLAAALYAGVAGWGVPVRRALVFLLALALGLARGRPALSLQPLAAAALGILAIEPEALFDAGAQLSFAASAAIALAARPAFQRTSRGLQGLHQALRTSASALAATAPLAAYHMGAAAPFALVANLLAVPWTAALLLPASLLGAVAAMGGGALGDLLVTAAARNAALTLTAVEWLAERLPGHGPGASPAPGWLAVAATLAVLALRAPRTSTRVALAAALSGVLALAPRAAFDPPPPRVVCFDVGQGDATLVQGRRGAVLVDAGVAIPDGPDLGRQAVVPALRALGVRRLDLVLATHADLDHRGGLPAVLAAIPVDLLWLPPGGRDEPRFSALRAVAAARNVRVVERGADSPPVRVGDLMVTPLWPPAGVFSSSSNDASLVVRIDVQGHRVLLPGDIESAAESALLSRGAELRADVLKLPHHGSRSSSTAGFLEAVGATLAVASAPWQGRFGMPHREVLDRASQADLSVWWTGRDGAVMIGLGERVVAWGLREP